MKRSLRLSMMVLFFFLTCTMPIASAVDPDVWQGNNISSDLFNTNHEVTSNGAPAYYQIDVTSKNGEEEAEGGNAFTKTFDTVGSWVSGDAIKDEVMAQFYEMMNFIVNIEFKMNLYLTNAMLTVLDYAFDFEAVNTIIERIDEVMQNLTGISGLDFNGAGLYGRFLGLIGVSVALLFAYQFFFKHARIEAVSNIVKTFLILVVSLVFFSNYATVLKGANHLTTEATAYIMGAGAGLDEEGTSGRESMGNNIWDLFVHRPYLYLQYGTDKESNVGESRVDELLALTPGESRQSYVESNEVTAQNNKMMTYVQVPERLVFTGLYLTINGITSIPIFALALLIIILQFWFLLIAALAPFFLIISAFPAGAGIFRRYLEELALPLILKMGVSFLALIVFTMSEIVYDAGNAESMGYFAVGLIEFAVLALMFMIRKRLLGIIFAGNQAARMLATEAAQFDRRVDNMRHSAASTASQVAGTMIAGPVMGAAARSVYDKFSNRDKKKKNSNNDSSNSRDSYRGQTLENERLSDDKAKVPSAVEESLEDVAPAMQTESLAGNAGEQIGGMAVGGGTAVASGLGAVAAGAVSARGESGGTSGNAPVMPTVPLQTTSGSDDIPSFLRSRAKQGAQTTSGSSTAAGSGAKIFPMPGIDASAGGSITGSNRADYDDASVRANGSSGGGLQTESLSASGSQVEAVESAPLPSQSSGGMAGLESLSPSSSATYDASERGSYATGNDASLFASVPSAPIEGGAMDFMPPSNIPNSGSAPTIVPLSGSPAGSNPVSSANTVPSRASAPSPTGSESFRTARGVESLSSTSGSAPVHKTIGDSEVPPARGGSAEDRGRTANIPISSSDEMTASGLTRGEIAEILKQTEDLMGKRGSGEEGE